MRDVGFSGPQDSGAMPAENTPPFSQRLAAEAKGVATDPINQSIAREVMRYVREVELRIAAKNPDTEN